MITITLEKNTESVWLNIDNNDWEISREAFEQFSMAVSEFDKSEDGYAEIRLDVGDEDYDAYSGEEY